VHEDDSKGGFLHIDKNHNRPDLISCIKELQIIENELKDSRKDSPVTGHSLNALNTNLCERRTRLQYIDALIDTMLKAFDYESQNRMHHDYFKAIREATIG